MMKFMLFCGSKSNLFYCIHVDQKFVSEMNNSENKYYSSRFMFGSNYQNISLVIDTQTDWTIVLAKDCVGCHENTQKYDRYASTTHQAS